MKMMTLHCTACGEDWQRPSQRGRPPKVCPDCKGTGAAPRSKPQKAAGEPKNSPKPEATPKAATPVSEDSGNIQESESGVYLVETSDGFPITTRDAAYAFKRGNGVSLACAHPNDLGKLCEREEYPCTCKCHEAQEAA